MSTVADLIVRRFVEAGVRGLFGMPGGGSNLDLLEAAARADVPFVLSHTETAGALMACAQAEITRAPGACLATLGPGVASLANGVAHATAAASTALRPMPPTPKTATLLPGPTLAVLNTIPAPVATAHPSKAASRSGMRSGIGVTRFSQVTVRRTKVLIAPELMGPSGDPYTLAGTSAPRPRIHESTTRSPGFTFCTPAPTSATRPDPS